MHSNGLLVDSSYDDLRSRIARCGDAEKFWSFVLKLPYLPPYQDVYLAGQLLPSFLSDTCADIYQPHML